MTINPILTAKKVESLELSPNIRQASSASDLVLSYCIILITTSFAFIFCMIRILEYKLKYEYLLTFKEHHLRAIRYLPSIVQLIHTLTKLCNRRVDYSHISKMSIGEFFEKELESKYEPLV